MWHLPRVINILADRALLGAYVEGKQNVSSSIVERAAREVFGNRKRYPLWLAASIVSASAGGMAWAYFSITTPELATFPADLDVAVVTPKEAIAPEEQNATDPAPHGINVPQASEREAAASGQDSELPAQEPMEVSADEQRHPAGEYLPEVPETIHRITRPPEGTYSTQRKAYTAVFARWGVEYDPDKNRIPCDFAPTVGLQCLSLHGSWSEVSQLNLPVILELADNQAVAYFGAVTATETDGRSFQFSLGSEVYQISPNDLTDVWSGKYVVLWKMPPDYHGSLRNGDDHPSVGWLRGQLTALVDARLTSKTPNRFDDNLHDAVVNFQRAEGLSADGVVGPATWIRLTNRLALPMPKLHS